MFGQAAAIALLLATVTLPSLRAQDDDDVPRVKTPLGSIRGYYRISEYGRLYAAYEGVPYALPPVGKRRFKPPQPIAAWPGELQATKPGHDCLQYNHKPAYLEGERVIGSEDCLYLNVYVPEPEGENESLPVVFWIHGGAFMHGSPILNGPKYLMDKNLIFVSVNYRVGPLGFLSTEDDIVSGNMGLKDQNLALRWVHENIEFFGGDPERITLIGLSAGGASVHYHYLSPLSANLFRNGISISGTALNCWTQTENPLEKAKKLGALMGCPTECTKEMVKCLRQRPARPIVQAVKNFMPWLYTPFTPFGPVVEKSNNKPFINRSPVEIINSKEVFDVPWITSVTSEEGLYPVAEYVAQEQFMKELDENWNSIAPHLLDFNYTVPLELHEKTAMKIREQYLGKNRINRKNVKPLINLVSDRIFIVDAEKAAKIQAKVNKSPVWFYYFSYRAAGSLSDYFSSTNEDFGVSHADDAFLAVESPIYDPTTTENDRAMQREILRLWASFAENGIQDLTSNWTQVDPSKDAFNYLHIMGPEKYEMVNDNNFGNKQFWSSINFEENSLKSINSKDEL